MTAAVAEFASWLRPPVGCSLCYEAINTSLIAANVGVCHRMQTIWKDDRWQPCGIQELLTPANIKKKYRKAIVLVHPDKQKGKDAAQVMLAERVFEKLKVRVLMRCPVLLCRVWVATFAGHTRFLACSWSQ